MSIENRRLRVLAFWLLLASVLTAIGLRVFFSQREYAIDNRPISDWSAELESEDLVISKWAEAQLVAHAGSSDEDTREYIVGSMWRARHVDSVTIMYLIRCLTDNAERVRFAARQSLELIIVQRRYASNRLSVYQVFIEAVVSLRAGTSGDELGYLFSLFVKVDNRLVEHFGTYLSSLTDPMKKLEGLKLVLLMGKDGRALLPLIERLRASDDSIVAAAAEEILAQWKEK